MSPMIPMMMTQLDRYLLRSLSVATIFVTIGLAMAIWMTQSLRLVELVVEGGAPISIFLQLALLTFPTFLSLVLPIGLMSAILFTYNRLIMDSELVVMRAAGMGPLRLARPAILLALCVSTLCYGLTVSIGPAAQRELVRLRLAIASEYSAVLLREGVFNDVGEGLTVYVKERSRDGELRGLLIHDTRTPGVRTTVSAERGNLLEVDGVARMVVYNGSQIKFHSDEGKTEWLDFNRYGVDLQILRKSLGPRWPDPRERPISELLTISNHPLDQEFASRLRAELHSRLATPLLALAFAAVALAALLPGEFSRKGQTKRIVTAACIGLFLQSAVLGLANLVGKSPMLTPLLYATVLTPVLGAVVYMKHWRLMRRRPMQMAAG